MISHITILCIWIAYACMEAVREAFFYHLNCISDKPIETNLHPIFTLQRAIVLILVLVHSHSNADFFVLAISCFCVFPCFHDGIYYYVRNQLNPLIYPKKFFDQSTTSTAFSTKFFTPVVRIVVALAGILGLIFIK